jgi:hypothetical protein
VPVDQEDLNKSQQSATKIDCQLSDIYKQLRPPLIKQQTFEDLSVSIVFQMLLFLANEHVKRFSNSNRSIYNFFCLK